LRNAVSLYRHLRTELFENKVSLQNDTDEKVMDYFDEIENREQNRRKATYNNYVFVRCVARRMNT